MYYRAVRKYAEKYWLISIFLIKEIKDSISMDSEIELMMTCVVFFSLTHTQTTGNKEPIGR